MPTSCGSPDRQAVRVARELRGRETALLEERRDTAGLGGTPPGDDLTTAPEARSALFVRRRARRAGHSAVCRSSTFGTQTFRRLPSGS